MGCKIHIAIVDTQKAQPIRTTSGEYFNKIIKDWPEVQKMLCSACTDAMNAGHFGPELIRYLEDDLKINGLAYSKQLLKERFWKMSDGPFEIIHQKEDVIRNNSTKFHAMVNEDMGVIEDYIIGYIDIPNDIGHPFFINEDAQRIFSNYNPRVIYQKDMREMIESWRKQIVAHYKEILMDPTKELRWRGHVEAKLDQWEFPGSEPYNMEDDSLEIVKAYDLEYRIFELVRLYKSINWMRDTVILFGW